MKTLPYDLLWSGFTGNRFRDIKRYLRSVLFLCFRFSWKAAASLKMINKRLFGGGGGGCFLAGIFGSPFCNFLFFLWAAFRSNLLLFFCFCCSSFFVLFRTHVFLNAVHFGIRWTNCSLSLSLRRFFQVGRLNQVREGATWAEEDAL